MNIAAFPAKFDKFSELYLEHKIIVLLNLAEYPLILAHSDVGLVDVSGDIPGDFFAG